MNVNNSTMYQAFGVLKLVLKKAPALGQGLQAYANCREQGFSIMKLDYSNGQDNCLQVSFSECRNSDQITVYYGTTRDFNFQTNIPTDDTYFNRRKFFGYESFEEAADWIVAFLKGDKDASN